MTRRSIFAAFALSCALAASPPAALAFLIPVHLLTWGTAGTGPGQFDIPVGVAVAPNGDLYTVETQNSRVQHFTPYGGFVAMWGAYGTGPGQLKWPAGIAIDETGFVYVADNLNQRVQKYTADGVLVASFSSGYVTGIAAGFGRVFACAPGALAVKVWTSAGAALPPIVPPRASAPDGAALDASGNLFVVDAGSKHVWKYSPTGTLLADWGSVGAGEGQFNYPVRAATDPQGNVYVVDHGTHRVEVFTNDGAFLGQWGSAGSGPGQFLNPIGIAIDHDGSVYVCDTNNQRLQKFGSLPVATNTTSWGRLKALYR